MKKLIHLYIAREIIPSFILGLFIFTFVLLMFKLLELTEMVVTYGVSIADVGRLISYILPPFFVFTVPMSFLLAVLLAFARLSADSELIAFRASGISLYQLYPVVGFFSLLTAIAAFFLTVYAEPWGMRSAKDFMFNMARTMATTQIKDHVFNDDFMNLVIYVNEVQAKKGRIRGVFIYDNRDKLEPNVILAKEGHIFSNPLDRSLVMRLTNGSIHRKAMEVDSYEVVNFTHYDINPELGQNVIRDMKKTHMEMSIDELREYIREMKETGQDYQYHRAHVEYHKKFAFPFAAIIFGFLGIPLAINPVRSGRSRGFTAALGVLVLYYLMFRVGETIGWKGEIHPIVVMWAPNVLLGLLGAYLFIHKANETEVQVASLYDKVLIRLGRLFERKT